MYKFAEELIPVDGAKENYYKLWINGECLIDGFWDKIEKEGNYIDDLDKAQNIIERKSRREIVPDTSFKELTGRKKSDTIKDYEIRVKKIRIYLFKCEKVGKMIVLGALKDDKKQKADIEYMRRIKKAYIKSKTL